MLPAARTVFGIHSFAPYSRLTKMPYGILKVLKDSSLSYSGALIQLSGGSSKHPWSVAEGKINAQLSLKTSEFPDFLFELFGGALSTTNSSDASGGVSTLTNEYGTSVKQATTGIASVSVLTGSEADLKMGKYIVKAITTTTVQVYCLSDVDFGAGTEKNFNDADLSLSATNFTITTGSVDTNLTGFGLKLTGGSGTIGMTIGDTASFEVRPKNTANMVMTLGAQGQAFPEFGAVIYGAKQGDGQLVEIDCPRVKGEGVPLSFGEDKFSEADVKCMVMYDAGLNYVLRARFLTRTTVL